MEKNEELRNRILPILLYCQANKGDLDLYGEWAEHKDANKKLFYAYYSGLFSRLLFFLEKSRLISHFVEDCNALLDKYNWFDIQDEDIALFCSSTECEVHDAVEKIAIVDDTIWEDTRVNFGDAYCWKANHRSWTFSDVRGSVHGSK